MPGEISKEKLSLWKNRYLLILGLFTAAMALKLFLFFTLTTPVFFFKYPFFADQINHGKDIGERILDLSPLYLYGMVLLQKIYGSNWEAMIIFQILAGSVNVVLIFLIGEKIFNRSLGLLAALLLLFYGNLTLFELTLEPDSFVLFLNSLFLLTLIWALENGCNPKALFLWLLSGLLLGMSVITKANVLLIFPGVIFWILESVSRDRKIPYALLFTLGVSLAILPVTVRNYVKFQDRILVTADMGKVFFHGNGPGATGMERADLPDQGFLEESAAEPDYAHTLFRVRARDLTHRPLRPSECSRFWLWRTLDYMQANPYSALKLLGKKFLLFWQNYEVQDLDINYAYYLTIRTWPLIPFGLIASLGVIGMGLNRKHFKQVCLPFLMVMVYLLTVIIFFNASRYRLPAVPFLALFAAYSLAALWNQFKGRQFKRAFWITGVAVSFFIFSVYFLKNEVSALDRWQQATRVYYNLEGNIFLKKGEYQKAIAGYQKAVALAPNFAPAYNQMGKAYALLNELDQAETNFYKVVALSPGSDQGYMNLGFLYEIKGDPPKAVEAYRKAQSLNPHNKKVGQRLQALVGK